jgi:hypothetical protein
MSLAPRLAALLMLGAPPRSGASASRGAPLRLVPPVSPGTPPTLAMRRPGASRLGTLLGTRILLRPAERLGLPIQPTLRSTRPLIPHLWLNHRSRWLGRQG